MVPVAGQSLNQLDGATFVQGFAKDQQIISAGVQMASRTFDVPEGHDAVAVQIDFVPGVAGYVSAGDRINLYGVYQIAVTDRVPARVELLLTKVAVLDVATTIAPRRGRATPDTQAAPRTTHGAETKRPE